MSPLLTYLAYTGLFVALLFVPVGLSRVVAAGSILQGLAHELGNREKPASTGSGFSGRAERAFRNGLESFAPFALLGVLAHLADRNANWAAFFAQMYFYSRVSFTLLYWAGITGFRTIAFYVGVAATVLLGLLDLGIIG